MKLGAVIEARMNSTRLPGKVLLKINGKAVIHLMVNRLRKINKIHKIVVATTINKKDDELCNYLQKHKIEYFRGSENDVLGRVFETAKFYKFKNIFHATGDCPLIDPEISSQMINTFLNNKFTVLFNSNIPSYPIGMDASVFSFKSLKLANKLAKKEYYREHSTLFFRKKSYFKKCNLFAPQNLNYPKLRLILDEKEDFKLISKIFKKFKKTEQTFSCLDIISYLNKNKNLLNINKKVKSTILPIKI